MEHPAASGGDPMDTTQCSDDVSDDATPQSAETSWGLPRGHLALTAHLPRAYTRRRTAPRRGVLYPRRAVLHLSPTTTVTSDRAALLFEDGIEVLVSVEEFARISPFFHAAFHSSFVEAATKSVDLSFVKSEHFFECCALLRKLRADRQLELHWMSLETAFGILETATFLLFDELVGPVSTVIVNTVEVDSLVVTFHRAENRSPSLASKLWRMVVLEFDKLLRNEVYINLTAAEILRLLDEHRLNVERVQEIEMLRKWIQRNDDGSEEAKRIREMFYVRVRVPMAMSTDVLCPRIPNSIVIACGGWSPVGPTTDVEALNTRQRTWVPCVRQLFDRPRAYHGVVASSDALYTLGGFDGRRYFNTFGKFDLNTLGWEELSPMNERRCYVSCGLLADERMIAIGGHDGFDRLSTAEVYHVPLNQWSRIASLNRQRSDGHCVVMDGTPYTIGGFDGFNCHDTSECFDAASNRWLELADSMHSRRSGVSAAGLHGGIFVCGGFNGNARLRSCEFIDPREGHWHRFHSMRRRRSNHGMEVIDNCLLVAGGYGGSSTIRDVEEYDLRAARWMEMPSLELRRSALHLIRVEFHDVIDTFATVPLMS